MNGGAINLISKCGKSYDINEGNSIKWIALVAGGDAPETRLYATQRDYLHQ